MHPDDEPLESFDDLKAAFDAAEAQRQTGDLWGAYQAYWYILKRRLSKRFIGADLVIIMALTDLAEFFGQVQAANNLLHGLVGLYEQAGNQLMADFALAKRVQLTLNQGGLHSAYDLLTSMAPRIGYLAQIQFSEAGLAQWEEGCHWLGADLQDRRILLAHLYLAMGRLLAALGQYGDALAALQRGLPHAQADESVLGQVAGMRLKMTIVAALLEKGDLALASAHLEQFQPELDEQQHPDIYVHWLELSGHLHWLTGDLGNALSQFRQVQQLCHNLGSGSATTKATLNLVHLLILLNQTRLAQDYLQDIQPTVAESDDLALVGRANLLQQLARERGRSLVEGSPAESVIQMRRPYAPKSNPTIEANDEAEELGSIPQSANYLTFFENRTLAVHWQLSRLNLEMADRLLDQIKSVFSPSDSLLVHLRMQILQGMLNYYQAMEADDPTTSQELLHQASQLLGEVRPTLEQLGLKSERYQVQRFLGWCWARLQHPMPEQETLTQETNALQTELTASLSPQDQAIYLLNKWTADEEYIATEINQLQRLQTSLCWWQPWQHFALNRRLNALIGHLDRYKNVLAKRTLGKPSDQAKIPIPSLWQRLFTHPRNRLTLVFLVLPDRLLVVRIGWLWLDFRVVPITRLEVRNIIQQWHHSIQRLRGGREISLTPESETDEPDAPSEMAKLTQALAEFLDIPALLQDLPTRIRGLNLVMDDVLHGFPFAAIAYGGQYLIDRFSLCTLYESQLGRSSPHLQQSTALVIGVSTGQGSFAPLPGVKQELTQIGDWLTQQQVNTITLENSTASKATVIDNLSQATLLHIACHGTFEPNEPDRSGFVLIPNSNQSEILSFRELAELNLTGLHHATLSSCWSADSYILPGRWIISLPETLWRSGCHSILACLWEVDDRVAVSFMTRFYQHLTTLPRDEALRLTQLDCLQHQLPDCQHLNTSNPIFWSGFSLYGNYDFLRPLSKKLTPDLQIPSFFKKQKGLEFIQSVPFIHKAIKQQS